MSDKEILLVTPDNIVACTPIKAVDKGNSIRGSLRNENDLIKLAVVFENKNPLGGSPRAFPSLSPGDTVYIRSTTDKWASTVHNVCSGSACYSFILVPADHIVLYSRKAFAVQSYQTFAVQSYQTEESKDLLNAGIKDLEKDLVSKNPESAIQGQSELGKNTDVLPFKPQDISTQELAEQNAKIW